jgi:hypothetical protein
MAALGNIASHLQSVHVHGNNYAPLAVVGGTPFPAVLEVTFLQRDGNWFHPDNAEYPTELDYPNFAGHADLYRGRWA